MKEGVLKDFGIQRENIDNDQIKNFVSALVDHEQKLTVEIENVKLKSEGKPLKEPKIKVASLITLVH